MMMKKDNPKRDLQDILTNASPKEKAILVCLHGTKAPAEDITLTAEEVAAITRSLTGYREIKEYSRWVTYYNVYTEIGVKCGFVANALKYSFMQAFAYIVLLERLQNEETFINALLREAPETADAIRDSLDSLRQTLLLYAGLFKIHIDRKGFAKIETDKLYSMMQDRVANIYKVYAQAKAFYIAQEEWTRNRRCAAIMPSSVKKFLAEIKGNWHIIAGTKYSRKSLAAREKLGEEISLEKRRSAVLPYYEEIEADKHFLVVCREELREIEENETRR